MTSKSIQFLALVQLFFCLFQISLQAQAAWKPVKESEFARETDELSFQGTCTYFQVDVSEINLEISRHGRVSLPLPGGSTRVFQVWEDPVLLSPLKERHPGLQSFAGKCMEYPELSLKLDLGPNRLHAMILSATGRAVFIDPYRLNGKTCYVVYHQKNGSKVAWECLSEDRRVSPGLFAQSGSKKNEVLRTYRLALAATAEYTAYHGGSVEVLAAQVATIHRINGIFERDLAIRLQIIGNNDLLIYTDASTDPYDPELIFSLQSQNQTNLDQVIGTGNYDIGHVFFQSETAIGVADDAAVCNAETKARAASGGPNPAGDVFDITYVAHEIGHQFGASHTHQSTEDGCFLENETAFEPGGGSTIMGYAGVVSCGPVVQLSSDAYFHGASIEQIRNFANGAGQSCAQLSPVSNTNPAIQQQTATYYIPIGTPFLLSTQAHDPEGDSLTYCWEQFDREVAPMPPQATAGLGPSFRSLVPKADSVRFFPDRYHLANGIVSPWEVLSEVARTLNFRVTVRDNAPGGGGVAFDSVQIQVLAEAGPFRLTQPNDESPVWQANSQQEIRWEVAGTDTSQINCSAIDLFLSVDAGKSYPYLLAAGVANTGQTFLSVPNLNTDSASLMIKCSDNIFWDVSDTLFALTPAVNATSMDDPLPFRIYPNPTHGFVFLDGNIFQSASPEIQLTDITGRLVFLQEVHQHPENGIAMDLSGLPAGIYVLNVQLDSLVFSRKIIRLNL
jgi:hypothetical protein